MVDIKGTFDNVNMKKLIGLTRKMELQEVAVR